MQIYAILRKQNELSTKSFDKNVRKSIEPNFENLNLISYNFSFISQSKIIRKRIITYNVSFPYSRPLLSSIALQKCKFYQENIILWL